MMVLVVILLTIIAAVLLFGRKFVLIVLAIMIFGPILLLVGPYKPDKQAELRSPHPASYYDQTKPASRQTYTEKSAGVTWECTSPGNCKRLSP